MASEKFEIDLVHSSIGFWVRHLVVSKVHGTFTKWTGTLAFDTADLPKSKVEISIDVASLDTREAQRDGHLKSADFLDVEKFPSIEFKSGKVEKVSAEHYKVHGTLTLHGVTKEVVLDTEYGGRAKDPWGGERVGFTGKTKIDRKEFGLVWNQALEAGGLLVGEAVEIVIELEAKKI